MSPPKTSPKKKSKATARVDLQDVLVSDKNDKKQDSSDNLQDEENGKANEELNTKSN